MSVLNKKPFIEKVLASMTQAQVDSLAAMLNGASSTIFRSYLNLSKPITSEDKGVNHCVFEVKGAVFTGYLIYNDTYCVLVAYEGKSQSMKMIELYPSIDGYKVVDEELSISEFRQVVRSLSSGAGSEDDANVYHYDEGDLLTDKILAQIKDGDIIVVNQMAFVIKKTNLTTHILITGDKTYIADNKPYMVQLEWDSANEETGLTLTTVPLAVPESE